MICGFTIVVDGNLAIGIKFFAIEQGLWNVFHVSVDSLDQQSVMAMSDVASDCFFFTPNFRKGHLCTSAVKNNSPKISENSLENV